VDGTVAAVGAAAAVAGMAAGIEAGITGAATTAVAGTGMLATTVGTADGDGGAAGTTRGGYSRYLFRGLTHTTVTMDLGMGMGRVTATGTGTERWRG
jgi:hypothetical protein